MLREFTTAAATSEGSKPTWEVLWLFLPDYNNEGNMSEIITIPKIGNVYDENDPDPYWS